MLGSKRASRWGCHALPGSMELLGSGSGGWLTSCVALASHFLLCFVSSAVKWHGTHGVL